MKRKLLLLETPTDGEYADKYGRIWTLEPASEPAFCAVCDSCFSKGTSVYIHRDGDHIVWVKSSCANVILYSDLWTGYENHMGIPTLCESFETCSKNALVVRDYFVWSDGVRRDYVCPICGRQWYAYYQLMQELDLSTGEVYIDCT